MAKLSITRWQRLVTCTSLTHITCSANCLSSALRAWRSGGATLSCDYMPHKDPFRREARLSPRYNHDRSVRKSFSLIRRGWHRPIQSWPRGHSRIRKYLEVRNTRTYTPMSTRSSTGLFTFILDIFKYFISAPLFLYIWRDLLCGHTGATDSSKDLRV